MSLSTIRLHAPFDGWLGPLGEVPDPVFAEGMMGSGMALDPFEGVVRAPCAAMVVAVAPTRHSITLRLANGADILIHVGLETVALAGAGFTMHVHPGQHVEIGARLLEFDLDSVAMQARSLITPIVVTHDGFAAVPLATGLAVKAGDPLFDVAPRETQSAEAVRDNAGEAMASLIIPMANGIHARPAARIADLARRFDAQTMVALGEAVASAHSVVNLMSLAAVHGDRIMLRATGPDAAQAVAEIAALIEGGMGEAGPPPPRTTASNQPSISAPSDPVWTTGVRAAPGCAIGRATPLVLRDIDVPRSGSGVDEEMQRFHAALASVGAQLRTGPHAHAILDAHGALLTDPALIEAAERGIRAGESAAHAWRQSIRAQIGIFEASGNALLIERIADLNDIERQLVAQIMDVRETSVELPENAILIARDILPSTFMTLDRSRLAGIVTANGGPTSHVAILAASGGIPMLVSAGEDVLTVAPGTCLFLDGDHGRLAIDPDDALLDEARGRIDALRTRHARDMEAAHLPCVTADGERIEVFANCGSTPDAQAAIAAGAEGCGLLRTEFLFLDRQEAPDEAEQVASYAAVAQALEGRPLIVRTLDVGGDKPLPFLPLPPEENPALGLRGIRLSFARPELLATQFRAILRAVPADQCRIMLPMIVDVAEFRAARSLLDQARADLGLAGPVPLGVMIETPAAALLADQLAAEADFLSIGSNDLTQYALAIDRGHAALASRLDALHPAVLRLIAATVEGARRHGRWVGVCGGIAADPAATAILIGLGVEELSVAPTAIPALKAAIRTMTMDACRALATRALAAPSAEAVRQLEAKDRPCD